MSKIYHLNELEDFYGEDEWSLQIDVTDLWNQYNVKEINLNTFNTEYYKRLLKYKSNIVSMGDDVWNKLYAMLEKMNTQKTEKELIQIYDNIYNWADQNDILIKTK